MAGVVQAVPTASQNLLVAGGDNDADGVVDVVSSGQVVAGGLDGLHVTRRDVACGTNECKVLHKGD